mgnify:CR=1 FL=1
MPAKNLFAEVPSIGTDVTDELKVIKWDPPLPASLSGLALGNFPSFIRKTDQERVQNMPGKLVEWASEQWEVTEKLDGASTTFFYNEGEFGICSRNLRLKIGTSTHSVVADKLGLKEKLAEYDRNIALQGEMVGPGVHGNIYQLKEPEFRLFDIWDIDTQTPVKPYDRQMLASELGIQHCPVLHNGTVFDKNFTVEHLLEIADGVSNLNPATKREGLVFKSVNRPEHSFKVISNAFLLG